MELTNSLLRTLLVADDQSYEMHTPEGIPLMPYPDSPLGSPADTWPDSMPDAWQADLDSWTVAKRFDDQATGFGATVFQKDVGNGKFDYIVAMQGTRGISAQDWNGNLTYGWEKFVGAGGQELMSYLLNDIKGDTNQIHFTGQSLGSSLAQFAAYRYADYRTQIHPDGFSVSNLSLTTFNGLGGVTALEQNYQHDFPDGSGFVPAIIASAATAHFTIANDIVSSLGGGRLNSANNEYLIEAYKYRLVEVDQTSLNGVPAIEVPKLVQYDAVDAHRIETGFYPR